MSFARDFRRSDTSSFHEAPDGDAAPFKPSIVGDISAAVVLCVVQLVNCVSVALILRGRWPDEYIDPLFRHTAYGFIVHQLVTSAMSEIPGIIAPTAMENLIVFVSIQQPICEALKDQPEHAHLVTFLAASSVSAVIASVLVGFAALPRLSKLLSHLPDYVRHGIFASIGVGILSFGFDAFDLQVMSAETWTNGTNLLKWCPAYILGLGLWYLDENHASRFLFIGFIAFVIAIGYLVRLSSGTSVAEAAKGGWLLGDIATRGFSEYFIATYGSLDSVDWTVVMQISPQLLVAAILGPLLNATINCVVLEGALRIKLNYSRELTSQSIGLLTTGMCFGFNSYFAVADTSLMRKAGGSTARPVVLMVFLLSLVCVVPGGLPMMMALIPTTLPASIFVFIGFAIAWGCVADMRRDLKPMEYCYALLTCVLCLQAGVHQGLFFSCCVCLVQHFTGSARSDEAGTHESNMSNVMLSERQPDVAHAAPRAS